VDHLCYPFFFVYGGLGLLCAIHSFSLEIFLTLFSLLPSVKQSIDWNDELNDDPGTNEDIAPIDNDGSEQASESKQGATNRSEENEWDKLLRVRYFAIPYKLVSFCLTIPSLRELSRCDVM